MADLYRSDLIDIDLNRPLPRSNAGELLATGDKLSNRYGVRVFRQGEAVNLSGYAVTGYFIRPDMETVVVTGAVSGNAAFVDLPQACYTQQGRFSLAVKISGGGITQTVRIVDGYIRTSQTGTLIDPGTAIPSLDDIFAQIAAMEQATAAAKTATQEATKATTEAQEATQEMLTTSAPAIIPTAMGEAVTISDSANRPLAGLRLYGKTTQDGVPTPDAPVPLVNVGAGGSIKAYARGKNLLNIAAIVPPSAVYNGITVTSLGNGFTATGTATGNVAFKWALDTPIPAGQYVLHARNIGTNAAVTLYFEKEGVVDVGNTNLATDYRKNAFVTDKPLTYLKLYIPSGVTLDVRMYPMLTVEDTDTREEYKDGGSLTASTPNGLPGIPVISGGNYTDESGQQWICDEIDFGRGVYVQRINKYVLDGSHPFTRHSESNDQWTRFDHGTLIGKIGGVLLSDYYVQRGTTIPNTMEVHGSTGSLIVRPAGVLTESEWKARIAANPVTVLVQAATPIETPLPADELSAFRAMTSQYPNTTVYNDSGVGMGVDYIADTQTYIDQRIAALLNA